MAARTGPPLREQLSVIMAALTNAAVAEIYALVDEGYAALRSELSRSRKENQDLRKKLHLIESVVIRDVCEGKEEEAEAPDPEPEEAAGRRRRRRRGDDDGEPGGAAATRGELPDVVLIKDEDSDGSDGVQPGDAAAADRVASAAAIAACAESVTPPPAAQSTKRPWNVEAERRSPAELLLKGPSGRAGVRRQHGAASSIIPPDSPGGEPGCSAPLLGAEEMEAGGSACPFSSQLDLDARLVQDCSLLPAMAYLGDGALMESRSSSSSAAELDLSVTWSKRAKSPAAFAQFHQDQDGDAYGLKVVSVSGSGGADEGDGVNFAVYGERSGPSQHGGEPAKGRRFACSVCNKTYATSQNLDVHMRIHTGERPFGCSQCGKTFTQSAHLKSHLNIHSGRRPYVCSLCHRSFSAKYTLTLHVKTCHPSA